MNHRTISLSRVALGLAGVAGLAAVVLAAPAPQAAVAAPAQQALSCKWQNIGNSQSDLFHGTTVMDTDQNIAYWYGGVDTTFATSNKVEKVDMSGAALSATSSPQSAGGALDIVGAAGAYRAKGSKADGSALYFFGGIKDPSGGTAVNDVQRFVTKTGKWEQVNVSTGSLTARVFAGAAYDPVHDVIWVLGGTRTCKLNDVLAGGTCTATSLAVQYLTFDPATGEPKEWKSLGASLSNYGFATAYDPMKQRVLMHGGTGDIKSGKSATQALDTSNADVTLAKLAAVSTSGAAPTQYFHGGAYDATHNWFVTYGGVSQNFLQSNEATVTKTMALDLAPATAAWKDLSPTGSPNDRVAGGLIYDPKHMAVVQILGRQKITFNNATPPAPTPKVQKSIMALTCSTGPTATVPPPTNTPGGPTVTPKPPTPTGPPPPTAGPAIGKACPGLQMKVPPAVIANALANPDKVNGWGQLCNPSLPPSPWNVMRTYLSLTDPGKPYNALFNGVEYKCGCP